MIFSENGDIVSIKNFHNAFIYFLLKNNEVVYVGQTTRGIIRPFSHTDKDFDEVKIIFCETFELNILEDTFIQKYKPMYNKQNNYATRWNLHRVRNSIRKQIIPGYTISMLKNVLKQLSISTEKDRSTGKETISFDEYKEVFDFLERSDKHGSI